MDAYSYILSAIKKLGYICDTLLYLIDLQSKLFSRRSSKIGLYMKKNNVQAKWSARYFFS